MPRRHARRAGGHRRRRRLRPDGGADAARCRHRLRAARARRARRRARPRCPPASSRRPARACSAQPACIDDSAERFAARHPGQGPRHAPRRTWWQAYTAGHRAGAGRAAAAPRPGVRAAATAFSTRATACGACTPLPQRTGAALVAALRRGRRARRRDAADRRAGARAVVRRRRAACSASATGGPTARMEQSALRRAAAGLQRLRRQPRRWCASCCRRCATPSSPATPATTAAPSPGAGSSARALADLGGYQGHGSWAVPQGALITWALMMEGGVQVNARGPALPRRDRRLLGSRGARAGAAGRRGVERVRRRGCWRWRARFPDFRRGRSGRRGAHARRRGGAGRADRLRRARRSPPRCAEHAALDARRTTRSRSPARCSTPRAAWTSTRSAACCATTARRSPTCWPPAARRAASRATRCGATCRATACSARWPAAASRRAPPRPQIGGDHHDACKQRLGASRACCSRPASTTRCRALVAEQAGFEALYLSGASIAYTRLGRSDVGLTTSTEVADTLARITERVRVPVIVDADTGFGNALNVQRTVRGFERAGAAMIQLEDQTFPKRCGHLDGKARGAGGRDVRQAARRARCARAAPTR